MQGVHNKAEEGICVKEPDGSLDVLDQHDPFGDEEETVGKDQRHEQERDGDDHAHDTLVILDASRLRRKRDSGVCAKQLTCGLVQCLDDTIVDESDRNRRKDREEEQINDTVN